MYHSLLILVLTTALALTILYVLVVLWFDDTHPRLARSLYIMGIIAASWIILTVILAVANERLYVAMLAIGVIFVCCLVIALLSLSLHSIKLLITRARASQNRGIGKTDE